LLTASAEDTPTENGEVVGVWRSADKYRGDPTWAGIAKAAVIVWGALMVFV
jgi:hypothetical protein